MFAGIIFITFVLDAVVTFEGTKSLWSIYWLVHHSEGGVVRIEDVIPEETLATDDGYIHRAFRFGRRNPDAGKMTLLYDSSGKNIEYQCAFNLIGNSYLFTGSNLSISDMPAFQKYLTFHELGHGSMLGGVIWINGKIAFFGGASAALFSVAVSHITSLGVIAIGLVLLMIVVYSRKVVVESQAETFADTYAIIKIAQQSPNAAIMIIRDILRRIYDLDPSLPRYDRLINKSRSVSLKTLLERLEGQAPAGALAARPPTKLPRLTGFDQGRLDWRSR